MAVGKKSMRPCIEQGSFCHVSYQQGEKRRAYPLVATDKGVCQSTNHQTTCAKTRLTVPSFKLCINIISQSLPSSMRRSVVCEDGDSSASALSAAGEFAHAQDTSEEQSPFGHQLYRQGIYWEWTFSMSLQLKADSCAAPSNLQRSSKQSSPRKSK
jgi:hypothetical protein